MTLTVMLYRHTKIYGFIHKQINFSFPLKQKTGSLCQYVTNAGIQGQASSGLTLAGSRSADILNISILPANSLKANYHWLSCVLKNWHNLAVGRGLWDMGGMLQAPWCPSEYPKVILGSCMYHGNYVPPPWHFLDLPNITTGFSP